MTDYGQGSGSLKTLAASKAAQAGVPGNLLFAVIHTESGWNPRAYRYEPGFFNRYIRPNADLRRLWGGNPRRISASYGLGQLMYTTALDLGFPRSRPPEDLYDPTLNLDLTIRLLDRLLKKHRGDVKDVIAAYNSGRPYAKAPDFTRNVHVPKVLKAMGLKTSSLVGKATSTLPSWTWLAVAGIAGVLLVALAAKGGYRGG